MTAVLWCSGDFSYKITILWRYDRRIIERMNRLTSSRNDFSQLEMPEYCLPDMKAFFMAERGMPSTAVSCQ
jgi:hypothetical protein